MAQDDSNFDASSKGSAHWCGELGSGLLFDCVVLMLYANQLSVFVTLLRAVDVNVFIYRGRHWAVHAM